MNNIYLVNCYVDKTPYSIKPTYSYLSTQKVEKGLVVFVSFSNNIRKAIVDSCEEYDSTKEYDYKLLYINSYTDIKLSELSLSWAKYLAYKNFLSIGTLACLMIKDLVNDQQVVKPGYDIEYACVSDKDFGGLKANKELLSTLKNNTYELEDLYSRYGKTRIKKLVKDNYLNTYKIKNYIDNKETIINNEIVLNKDINFDDKKTNVINISYLKEQYLFIVGYCNKLLNDNKSVIIICPNNDSCEDIYSFLNNYFIDIILYKKNDNDSNYYVSNSKHNIIISTKNILLYDLDNIKDIIVLRGNDSIYNSMVQPQIDINDLLYLWSKDKHATITNIINQLDVNTYNDLINKKINYIDFSNNTSNINIIDMKRHYLNTSSILAKQCLNSLIESIKNNKQVLIVNNRIGSYNQLICPKCLHILKCKKCNHILSYHEKQNKLICHHCYSKYNLTDICPNCGNKVNYLQYSYGNQVIVKLLQNKFNNLTIDYFDSETNIKKLKDFNNGKINILVASSRIERLLINDNVDTIIILNGDQGFNRLCIDGASLNYSYLRNISLLSNNAKIYCQVNDINNSYLPYISSNDDLNYCKYEYNYRLKSLLYPYVNVISLYVKKENELNKKIINYFKENNFSGPYDSLDNYNYQYYLVKGKSLNKLYQYVYKFFLTLNNKEKTQLIMQCNKIDIR